METTSPCGGAQAQAASAAVTAMDARLQTGVQSNEGWVGHGVGVAICHQRTRSVVERWRPAHEPSLSQVLVRPNGTGSLLDTLKRFPSVHEPPDAERHVR